MPTVNMGTREDGSRGSGLASTPTFSPDDYGHDVASEFKHKNQIK